MTGRHPMWDGGHSIEVEVPTSGGENVMLPVIRVVVTDGAGTAILLQRRDDPSEPVRGSLEIPGGRWRSGEPAAEAAMREVAEETGITLLSLRGVDADAIDDHRTIESIRPLVVVAGTHGAFPAIHIVLVGVGEGEPSAEDGHSTDVRWWPLADVARALQDDRGMFIPSSYAALTAFLAARG